MEAEQYRRIPDVQGRLMGLCTHFSPIKSNRLIHWRTAERLPVAALQFLPFLIPIYFPGSSRDFFRLSYRSLWFP